jgi:hypothetical protein
MKILIRKANTDDAWIINPVWLSEFNTGRLLDYVSELRQYAQWHN